MTTLLDKKQSVIGKVQDLDEATPDQCFRASPRWRRWSRGTLATLSKVGDCRAELVSALKSARIYGLLRPG